jgi:16S rRNA (guanine1207-N2)-methyltransferase
MGGEKPTGHYFESDPQVPSRPSVVELELPDVHLRLVADRGVFSASRVDPGTLALLRGMPSPPAAGHLLDLGCGYGPIACTLARRSPGATVWAVDVNRRAVELTEDNAVSNFLPNVRACEPDGVPERVMLDGLWSNPPVRVGKEELHRLLEQWLPRLVPGAPAWLVVHKNLGGDSLARWLDENGWEVRRLGSRQGYRLMRVSKPAG